LAWGLAGHAKIKIVHQSSDFDSFALAFCFAIRIALAYCSFKYRMNAGVTKSCPPPVVVVGALFSH
jgi:hypothetical protein